MGKTARKQLESPAPLQYAALPWRRGVDGGIEVLLVTSRGTGRWVIPKGWPMKGKSPRAAAAREAWEEAGVKGLIGREPIGAYGYGKRCDDGAVVEVRVEVLPLEVTHEDESWPEMLQRERSWICCAEAARAVDEPELRDVILAFSAK